MSNVNNDYFQQVKASGRMFGFLGLMLGVTGGVLTGVAVKGLVDEPVVSGGGAVAFYGAFALSSLMTLYVMLNYLSMSLRLSGGKFDIRLGMKSAIVETADVKAVRVATPASRMARAATQTRPDRRSIARMWSVLGVKTGIEIDIATAGGTDETWFIASLDPETLQEKLQAEIPTSEELAASALEASAEDSSEG